MALLLSAQERLLKKIFCIYLHAACGRETFSSVGYLGEGCRAMAIPNSTAVAKRRKEKGVRVCSKTALGKLSVSKVNFQKVFK